MKPRLGQGRAGVKQKRFRFLVCQWFDKSEQPKLLPGRKPFIQIIESHILQQTKNIIQPKMRLTVSIAESSRKLKTSWLGHSSI